MLAKREMSGIDWNLKHKEMEVKHTMENLEKAADDLRTGWNAWLVDSMDLSIGGNHAVSVPATGIT